MNILDENILEDQRQMLRSWRIPVRQIGSDLWHKGIQDDEIPRLLRRFRRPTFFTRDLGFYDHRLCHAGYAIVVLEVRSRESATFVRRYLLHPDFSSQVQRLGTVALVNHRGIHAWRRNAPAEEIHLWQ